MPWHSSRRIGGTPASPPRHLVEHEQHVEDFLAAQKAAKASRARAVIRDRLIRFTKLPDGTYAIRSVGKLKRGKRVTVHLKNGTAIVVKAGRVIRQLDDGAWATRWTKVTRQPAGYAATDSMMPRLVKSENRDGA